MRTIISIAATIMFISAQAGAATTWYVSPGGTGNGKSASTPCTIQRAFDWSNHITSGDHVQPGDSVLVLPGEYDLTQTLYIQYRATAAGPDPTVPVTRIEAFEGPGSAVLNGWWRPTSSSWQTVTGGATDEYKQKLPAGWTGTAFAIWDGSMMLRYNAVEDLRSSLPLKYRESTADPYRELRHPGAGFAINKVGSDYWVHVRWYGANPNPSSPATPPDIRFSTPTYGENPVRWALAEIINWPKIEISGLSFVGSGRIGLKANEGSQNLIIHNSSFYFCRFGAKVPHETIIEWSEYAYPTFADRHYDLANLAVGAGEPIRSDYLYDWTKIYHRYGNHNVSPSSPGLPGGVMYEGALAESVANEPSRHCEFRYNYLYETFDAEHLGSFRDSSSHHNIYDHNFDNHVEMEDWHGTTSAFGGQNLDLYSNLMLAGAMGPISFDKNIVGPQWIFNNVVYYLNEIGAESWTIIKNDTCNSAGCKTPDIIFEHNTFYAVDNCVYSSPANLNFVNNAFVFEVAGDTCGSSVHVGDYNYVLNNLDLIPLTTGRSGYFATNTGSNLAAIKFKDTSAGALDFGIDVTGTPKSTLANKAAPGSPDPHLGAHQNNTNTGQPNWPRKRGEQWN